MHYKNPEGLKDLNTVCEALEGHPGGLAALMRLHNDLDTLTESLDLYGIHKSGHGCDTKKHPDACNCGLDRRRERAGLPRTMTKDGPAPWARK